MGIENRELILKIQQLKTDRDAVILAHNYQNDEIQEIADIVGDSLALSRSAAGMKAEIIIFCGVHFMAESAAILAPGKTVILPAADAGCPMAEMAEHSEVLRWRQSYPNAAIVSYVNSTAAVKAVSDYCCTSANAVKLVRNIPESEVIFLPDQNLGHFVADRVPEKVVRIWPGYCITHHRVNPEDVWHAKTSHPDALVLVHPECRPEVTEIADFIGSTSQIIEYVGSSSCRKFIIGTEMGILYNLTKHNPGKTFYLLSQGLVCPNMKLTTLPKVLQALVELKPRITVTPEIQVKAREALNKMLLYVE